MALIKCKECGKEISSQAESCPNCGRKKPKPTSAVTWIVVTLLGMGIFSAVVNSGKHDEQVEVVGVHRDRGRRSHFPSFRC